MQESKKDQLVKEANEKEISTPELVRRIIDERSQMKEFIEEIYSGLYDKSIEDGAENDDKLTLWERSVKRQAKRLLNNE